MSDLTERQEYELRLDVIEIVRPDLVEAVENMRTWVEHLEWRAPEGTEAGDLTEAFKDQVRMLMDYRDFLPKGIDSLWDDIREQVEKLKYEQRERERNALAVTPVG